MLTDLRNDTLAGETLPPTVVRQQLQKLLSSSELAHAERLAKLLRFVVEETALACLEAAVGTRESFAIFLKAWPSFGTLHSEPRFRSLLDRVGLQP